MKKKNSFSEECGVTAEQTKQIADDVIERIKRSVK